MFIFTAHYTTYNTWTHPLDYTFLSVTFVYSIKWRCYSDVFLRCVWQFSFTISAVAPAVSNRFLKNDYWINIIDIGTIMSYYKSKAISLQSVSVVKWHLYRSKMKWLWQTVAAANRKRRRWRRQEGALLYSTVHLSPSEHWTPWDLFWMIMWLPESEIPFYVSWGWHWGFAVLQ